jgi:hypothetical protein
MQHAREPWAYRFGQFGFLGVLGVTCLELLNPGGRHAQPTPELWLLAASTCGLAAYLATAPARDERVLALILPVAALLRAAWMYGHWF